MDLHSGQCVGYFDIPVDHVYGDQVLLEYLASKRISTGDLVVVSPDVGGVARARAFAKKLNDAPLAIVDKRRSAHNVSEVMNLIGDVNGKVAVLVDDMIDTAGENTLTECFWLLPAYVLALRLKEVRSIPEVSGTASDNHCLIVQDVHSCACPVQKLLILAQECERERRKLIVP